MRLFGRLNLSVVGFTNRIHLPMDDLYTRLLERLRQEYVPYHVIWEITHRCNLDCIMCYNAPVTRPELSQAEGYSILEQLAAAGTLRLTLTGGEVLTSPHFFHLATYARQAGFALDIKTNATLLTPNSADKLAALKPVQVDVSLLAATSETADRITKGHRALERTLRGISLLVERNVPVKLNSLLMDTNLSESEALVSLARAMGLPHEQFVKISPDDRGVAKAAKHQLDQEAMTRLYATNLNSCGKGDSLAERTCQVGMGSCLISPDGIVYPCIELRIPLGDLRQQPFAEIWRDSPMLQRLRSFHTRSHLHMCNGCELQEYCEGRCAGVAFKESGDWLAADSLACRQAQAHYVYLHPESAVPTTPFLSKLSAIPAGDTVTPPVHTQPIDLIF